MKLNFIQRYFIPIAAAAAAAQAAIGLVQTISGNAKAKKLLAQRTAYKTPEEIFKMLNLTLSGAPGDTITRDFQTDQIDRTFSQITGNATRLGADPNDLSALFDQKMNSIMKVGQQFHASNMEAMSKVLSAYDVVAANKSAEWSSQQDIIKDKLQAASAEKAAGIQNIGSAVNAGISLSASAKTSDLYKQIADALTALKKSGTAGVASTIDTSMLSAPTVRSGMNEFSDY